jgi:hypothetical protein
MMLFAQPDQGPWDFLLKWVPTIGWPAVLYLVWKVRGFLAKAEERAIDAEGTLVEIRKNVAEHKKLLEDHCTWAEAFLKEKLDRAVTILEGRYAVTHTPNPIVVDKTIEDSVVRGFQELNDLIHNQGEVTKAQFNIMRDMAQQQATIAANQNNITNGFQRMVEQLIAAAKGV